jgi:hypothetical protein
MNEFNLKKVFKWQQLSKPIVKKYVADLYQAGTDAPVAKELYNDTDVAFTYEYIAPGVYSVTSNKDLFTALENQKIQVTITNGTFIFTPAPPMAGNVFNIVVLPVWSNVIIIQVTDTVQGIDNYLGHFLQNAIEITIYP